MLVDIVFVVVIVGLLIALYKVKFSSTTQPQYELPRQQIPLQDQTITADHSSSQDQMQQNNITNRRKQLHKQQKLRQKKQRKEAMEHYLQGQKKRRQAEEKERTKRELEEEQKQRIEDQVVAQLHQEQRKKRQQEFSKWKDMFKVEAQGNQQHSEQEQRRKQKELHDKILAELRNNKLCLLEDLSQKYQISTKELVEIVKGFEQQGVVKGIFDERGKYLVITQSEWDSIKQFICSRGRAKKIDIMKECARLIKIPEHVENSHLLSIIDQNQ